MKNVARRYQKGSSSCKKIGYIAQKKIIFLNLYDKNGFKDGSIDSYGSNYATMTDYTNWKGTNRLTLGLGYTVDKVSIDLAYQYTTQKGDFYPFMNSWADYHYIDDAGIVQTEQIDNYATKTEVKDSRHQLLLTLGYHF